MTVVIMQMILIIIILIVIGTWNENDGIFIAKDLCTSNSKDNEKASEHLRLRDLIRCPEKAAKQQTLVLLLN